MKKITMEELIRMAVRDKNNLWQVAKAYGRDVKIYLHWSAGHYGQFFADYHITIDADGSIYVSTEDLSEVKNHTWHRNSGAIGMALAACAGATTDDLGDEAPTTNQIETMAQVVAVLCSTLAVPSDGEHILTHAEAADEDDYGPATNCERWDLWFIPGVEKGEGGNVLREKAVWYQNH